MNPLIQEGVESIRNGWVLGVTTVLFMACFGAWIWWAYRPSNRKRMEEAARLPFTDGGDS